MTKTINRLPAILLAVIIAAALAFAAWASLQPAYAEDEGALPPAEPKVNITSDFDFTDGNSVPGMDFGLEASFEGFPAELQQMIDAGQYDLSWELTEGLKVKPCAHITPDADDPTNPMKARLYVDYIPEASQDKEFMIIPAYWAVLTVDGQTFESDHHLFNITDDFTVWTYDRQFDEDICNLQLGQEPVTVDDMQVMHYSLGNEQGVPVAASYQWNYDPEEVKIEPATVASTTEKVGFTVERLTSEEAEFSLQVSWGKDEGALQYYNFLKISNNLEDYYIDTGTPENRGIFVVPEEGGQVDSLDISLKNWDDDTVLPEEAYDLKIEKVIGYDEDTFDDIVDEASFPLKPDTWDEEGNDAEDLNGNITTGTAVYKVTATAKEGSGFTGSTYDYILLYSDKTLNYYAADAEFVSSDKYLKFLDAFPYAQYEVPVGTKLTLEVKAADGKTLTEGTDYVAYYVNDATGDDVTEFPQTAGLYKVTIIGKGEYYGTTEPLFEYVKIGKKNPMTVKAKTVKAKAKKKTVIKTKKAFTVKKAQGKVTYKKVSGNKKITVAKNGKVTVKKGLKKGKTYKVKVKVSTPGNANYLSAEKTVTMKVKITK